jgi:hypothetical protein
MLSNVAGNVMSSEGMGDSANSDGCELVVSGCEWLYVVVCGCVWNVLSVCRRPGEMPSKGNNNQPRSSIESTCTLDETTIR